MNLLNYKGKRIRASDKGLVYRFCAGTLLFLFIAVLLLLNMGQLMRTDWEHFSLRQPFSARTSSMVMRFAIIS